MAGLSTRLSFGKHFAAKFFSIDGMRRLIRNPSSLRRHARTFLFDANLADATSGQQLDELTEAVSLAAEMVAKPQVSFDEWLPIGRDQSDLAKQFNDHGSDKASYHDYYEIYGSILGKRRYDNINILEVGLGTNNLDVTSNMGAGGTPGASLRAFRDWAPNANVFGADVDRRILFTEERIQTYWVDQTNQPSLDALVDNLKEHKFDLIIDDGLHLPHANMRMLSNLLPLLQSDGTYVVEDINCVYPFWKVMERSLADRYDTYFTKRKGGFAFVLRHKQ